MQFFILYNFFLCILELFIVTWSRTLGDKYELIDLWLKSIIFFIASLFFFFSYWISTKWISKKLLLYINFNNFTTIKQDSIVQSSAFSYKKFKKNTLTNTNTEVHLQSLLNSNRFNDSTITPTNNIGNTNIFIRDEFSDMITICFSHIHGHKKSTRP